MSDFVARLMRIVSFIGRVFGTDGKVEVTTLAEANNEGDGSLSDSILDKRLH